MIKFLLRCKQFMIGNFLNFKFEFSKKFQMFIKKIVLTTISDKNLRKTFYFFKVNHIKFIFHFKSKRNLTTQKIFYWFPFVLMHILLWMLKKINIKTISIVIFVVYFLQQKSIFFEFGTQHFVRILRIEKHCKT